MVRQVVIFDARQVAKKKHLKINLRWLSNFLLLFCLLSLLAIFGPSLKKQWDFLRQPKKVAWQAHFSDLLKAKFDAVIGGVPDPNFSLIIPKVGVKTKVIPNVDPASFNEYSQALKSGVAHAKGTAFPGMAGTVYIFGHSSVYSYQSPKEAVFILLHQLEKDDQVLVYFSGVKYRYKVTEKKILERTDLSYYYQDEKKEKLVLQTCWPPGTSLKQLIIVAEPTLDSGKTQSI